MPPLRLRGTAMETLLRPMGRGEQRLFTICLVVSLVVHVLVAFFATGGGRWGGDPEATAEASRLAEHFARAVNAATEIDDGQRARLESALAEIPDEGWGRELMVDTLQWLGDGAGVRVDDADVVRALDAERSREGRWDIRVWMEWRQDRSAADLLLLAYLIGEGTLKSDFGSHRLWLHLEGEEGSGRVALETMDCRLYRAGKLGAADLLHRSQWVEP